MLDFPRMLHRPDGSKVIVRDGAALDAKLASGWYRHAGPAPKPSVVAAEVAPVEIAPVAAPVVTPIVEPIVEPGANWTVSDTDVETASFAPVADAEVAEAIDLTPPKPSKRKAKR